ncbi:hypothetical protein Tco_0422217 [Tanacetum coccineum]
MVRLWWPQPARPPPQRWRQAGEHSEAPPRGCAATARHHMVFRRLWWLISHPQPTTAATVTGKAVVVVVVSEVVRRRGGGEGGVVGEVRFPEKYRQKSRRKRWRLDGKICRKSFPAATADRRRLAGN